jgi:hypothetical protein
VLLLYNIARVASPDGRVFFDEYHHSIRSGGSYWDYFRYHQMHWLVLQLVGVVGIAAWGVAVRLGPARATPLATHADAVDYASAVARIYQRTGVHRLLAQHLVRDFIAALTRLLHLRPTATPEVIHSTARHRLGSSTANVVGQLLHLATQLQDVDSPKWQYSRRDLLSCARQFDQLIRSIQSKNVMARAKN